MNASDLIRRHEGERLKPYLDTATPPRITIGIGRNLTDRGISRAEMDMLFANDLLAARDDLDALAPWHKFIGPVRQAVLLDMIFNMGRGGLSKFKRFLAAMHDSDWPQAAAEMRDSAWWRQVGARAVTLEKMVLTGQWP